MCCLEQVHRKLASSASNGDMYETELLEQLADSEAAVEFFTSLDIELNKVNQFYKMKEKEFLERGECLKKQMTILVELQTVLQEQQAERGAKGHELLKEDESISYHLSCGKKYQTQNSYVFEWIHQTMTSVCVCVFFRRRGGASTRQCDR